MRRNLSDPPSIEGGVPEPKDQPDVTHRIEPVNEQYNVGEVIRDMSREYLGQSPNKVTPENMVVLLEDLQELTSGLLDADDGRQWLMPFVDPCDQLFTDLYRWKMRLEYYLDQARRAADKDPTDRNAILWTVTAPLFLGYYGGPTGTELPLPGRMQPEQSKLKTYVGSWSPVTGVIDPKVCVVPAGQSLPPGFDPSIKHPADLTTPFSLANQLEVFRSHAIQIAGQLKDDIITNAKDIGKTIVFPSENPYLKYALVGAGAVAGLYVVTKFS